MSLLVLTKYALGIGAAAAAAMVRFAWKEQAASRAFFRSYGPAAFIGGSILLIAGLVLQIHRDAAGDLTMQLMPSGYGLACLLLGYPLVAFTGGMAWLLREVSSLKGDRFNDPLRRPTKPWVQYKPLTDARRRR